MHYSIQDLLWVIGSLSKVFRIPFDPQLILQQFPPPYSRTALLNILQKLDFKVGAMELDSESIAALERLPFPAVAFLRAAGQADNTAQVDEREVLQTKTLSPVLLVKADAGRVLYFRAGSEQPETLPLSELAQHIRTDILLVAREAAQVVDEGDDESAPSPSGNASGQPPFGFRWFIPELLRHKRIWRDILIASFFIQLVGLVTPLFTQVIIDKVVVHQTQSTLIAIAVGLVMFMLFNSAMTWLRQYFVLHTGNRIDAVLGSQVFRHLLHLPMPYFERRPTGTLVARMHGVETVREFVSGAAVTLLLDFPFLLIFVAVMFWYSWQLTLIALLLLSCIAAISVAVTPAFRKKLDHQFLLGARNQAFLTEYVAGMETVKSLQMEPVLEQRYGEFLASYLAASFSTRQLSNTYNVIANSLEQIMTLSILVAGALLVMQNDGFTIGMLVAFQMFASRMSQPMLRLAGLWQEFQQA
ncbi:MAG: ABC transporter transmembrane domain-containing protein, partial [Gallionellaceae bacterium]|nr:ABC transporter transmembrane domain-containing protein [Gallionellaceae bacterium]